jgi:hypothetical protein
MYAERQRQLGWCNLKYGFQYEFYTLKESFETASVARCYNNVFIIIDRKFSSFYEYEMYIHENANS